MMTFDRIEDALDYVVTMLVPLGHAYIVNIVGPDERETNCATTVQVVAQHMVFNDNEFGLTLNLPFDPASGTFTELIEFMGSPFLEFCDEYKFDGVPCFALRFGVNVGVAATVVRYLLGEVYGYKEPTTFKCEVYDEGRIE